VEQPFRLLTQAESLHHKRLPPQTLVRRWVGMSEVKSGERVGTTSHAMSRAEKITVERIEHVAVTVSDIDRAKEFYGGVLGLTEVPRPETFDFPGAWYRNGPTDLHIISRAQIDGESRRHVAFFVSDLQVAARVLEAHGYPVLWETMKISGIDRFFTRDPDGNRIEVMAWEGK
jgi:catechol 2,3-dioxygenase-like lactoylglutathione lyase family enzyme